MSAFKTPLLRHTQTHARARARTDIAHTHTRSHSGPRLYRRILSCHASLTAFPAPLPYSRAQNDSARTSVYINALTPTYTTCENKAEDALASARLLRVFSPRPTLSLDLLRFPAFPPRVAKSPQILTEVNILNHCMCLRFQSQIIPSRDKKPLFFLLRCRSSLRAFLDAGAFE